MQQERRPEAAMQRAGRNLPGNRQGHGHGAAQDHHSPPVRQPRGPARRRARHPLAYRPSLTLAEAVSWRSIHGPAWRVVLAEHGPGAQRTAKALGMHIEDGLAYLTARTSDLAERMLSRGQA